uniref:Putative alpha-L-fucosidase n=1 Tax=Dendroctonus ponderosae TaxID=77166 RepID=A0AAR5PFR6_DENPD
MKTGVFFATLWLFWLHLAWATKYEPNWKSLDKRPLPDWFDKAKIGIFLHWGVFSVPSFGSEWFWSEWQSNSSARINSYMKANYPPNFTYQDFAKDFSAEFFNSSQWADLFKRAGANYVVLTSKHHEGFTLWPSEYSFSWNAKDIGPHRDLLGDLGNAVKRAGLKFGVYHSLFEWFNPIYLADKRRNFTTQKFVDNKVLLEMKELVSNYKPWVIWSDGDWEADDTYWRSTDFLAWLYNESPVKDQVVVNDRWGRGTTCIHGDFINCHDRYNPGKLQRKKWENAMTLDRESWGFRRNADLSDYLTPHQLLTVLAQTISCGGNLLINLGPTKEGTIAPIFQDRLTQLGAWLRINGEAIYNSRPWIVQNDTVNPQVWYTSGNNAVYAIDLEWPLDNKVILGGAVSLFKSPDTAVSLLGNLGKLKWVMNSRRVEVHLPDKATAKSEGAWVLKIATSN